MDAIKENESIFFKKFKEASEYAKGNRGTVLTKSPSGVGYICRNSASTTRNIELRKTQNISQGKPVRSHLPWRDQERSNLIKLYENKVPLNELTRSFGRTELAIINQLRKMQLITIEEYETYLTENNVSLKKKI